MTEPRWIKLSERKPNKRGYYYFYDPTAHNDDSKFETRWFCDYCSSVTHWLEMELPPLPKEEKLKTKYQQICNQCRPFQIGGTQGMFWDKCALCYQMANCVYHSSVEREGPKEEKPVDPDWESLEVSMTLWRTVQIDTDSMIVALYRFLKAKYGK